MSLCLSEPIPTPAKRGCRRVQLLPETLLSFSFALGVLEFLLQAASSASEVGTHSWSRVKVGGFQGATADFFAAAAAFL